MCLVTKQRRAKIAKKDITCYKRLHPDLRSYYQNFKYSVGVLVTRELRVEYNIKDWFPLDSHVAIVYGDPMYMKGSFMFSDRNEILRTKSANQISDGLHASLSIDRIGGVSVYEFVIPAGSEYFIDKTGLIVSNQIMLVNDINLYKP